MAREKLLANVQRFVNESEFLPHRTALSQVTASAVLFRDGQGKEVSLSELSDGFRSTLSLIFELLRQLVAAFGIEIFSEDGRSIIVPGVVMIDEVDAYLHPSWQHRIGQWFKACFPRIQFFVTTHSPIICQAAEGSTIFRLPTPGANEEGKMLEGPDRDRLIFGDVLDAYGTKVFGEEVTRSESAKERLDELARLNLKELSETGLTAAEQRRQQELRATEGSQQPVCGACEGPSCGWITPQCGERCSANTESSPACKRSSPQPRRR